MGYEDYLPQQEQLQFSQAQAEPWQAQFPINKNGEEIKYLSVYNLYLGYRYTIDNKIKSKKIIIATT